VRWYEKLLLEDGVRKSDMGKLPDITNIRPESTETFVGGEGDTYEALCRGEVTFVSALIVYEKVELSLSSESGAYFTKNRKYISVGRNHIFVARRTLRPRSPRKLNRLS
jgi:hypothetical protein